MLLQLLDYMPTMFTFLGIPVRVHLTTFLCLFMLLLLSPLNAVYYLLLLLFIIPHEFGHALVGRRFNMATEDIILLPIGGIARMSQRQLLPWIECLVVGAGPAVSLLLGGFGGLLLGLGLLMQVPVITVVGIVTMWLNLLLFLFNMVPIFPMDGGRLLRATIHLWMRYDLATWWAARIGQVIGAGLIGFGICTLNFGLVVTVLLMTLVAEGELEAARALVRQDKTK